MGAQPYWGAEGPEASAWDTVFLGDIQLPGIVEVTAQKARGVDVKAQKGVDLPEVEDTGYQPGKVTIRVRLVTAEDWQAWQRVYVELDPQTKGGVRTPYAIQHPEPNSKGITEVYVTEISGDPPTSKSGKTETIECLQVGKSKPANTGKDAKQKAAGSGNATANARLNSASDDFNQALLEQESAEEALAAAEAEGDEEAIEQAIADQEAADQVANDSLSELAAAREAAAVPNTQENLFT